MKLTRPQLGALRLAAEDGGYRAIDSYPPIRKLVRLGYIACADPGNFGNPNWVATDAGRAALSTLTRAA